MAIQDLFGKELTVLNLGLAGMSQSVKDQGVKVVDIDWQPPKGDIPRLHRTKSGISMDDANAEASRLAALMVSG